MAQLEDSLTQLGLSEREATVYLAALRLGATNVRRLAAESNVKRSTLYSVIDRLYSIGLLREEENEFRRVIVPAEPQQLEVLLARQRQVLTNILPNLESIFHLKESTFALKRFEGIDAIRKIYSESLTKVRPGDYYYVISHSKLWIQIDESFLAKFIKQRAKAYEDIRLLLREFESVHERTRHQGQWNVQAKFLPDSVQLETALIVIPRRVIVHRFTAPFSIVVVENAEVVGMMKALFETFWAMLPDEKRKK